MTDPRTLQHLLRRPSAMQKYLATGDQPRISTPRSPLITLLRSLYPRERHQITALRVSAALGYSGQRTFHTAEQALSWLVPHSPASHIPSESWQDRRFQQQLTIDDLSRIAKVPITVSESWWARHQHLGHPGGQRFQRRSFEENSLEEPL